MPSTPLIPGKPKSVKIRSGLSFSTRARAVSALPKAAIHSKPSVPLIKATKLRRMSRRSSIRTTRKDVSVVLYFSAVEITLRFNLRKKFRAVAYSCEQGKGLTYRLKAGLKNIFSKGIQNQNEILYPFANQ